MDSHGSSSAAQEQDNERRRTLRSHRNRDEVGASDNEAATHSSDQRPAPLRRCSTRTRFAPSSTDSTDSALTAASSSTPPSSEPFTVASSNPAPQNDLFARGREPRFSFFPGGVQLRRGRDSAVGSPSRGNLSPTRPSVGTDIAPRQPPSQSEISAALEDGLLGNNLIHNSSRRRTQIETYISASQSETPGRPRHQTDSEPSAHLGYEFIDQDTELRASVTALERAEDLSDPAYSSMSGSSKRSRDQSRHEDQKDLLSVLKRNGAVTAMLYRTTEPVTEANDIWPNFRNKGKLPVRYSILTVDRNTPTTITSYGRPPRPTQDRYELRGQKSLSAPASHLNAPNRGRPFWHLPVELVEQIIEHLNRDDIKSLRLVSRELNDYTSQAAFKTVVVPFNTEIYGMLGQGSKTDRKGKKRAKISRPEYWWKNANGDELYNGHGLDVFRGFGRHILRYGMSFEVNEDALSAPPLKSVTEQKTSFWGNYEWPFEEYRRFDAVAGLESAADETPRMKTAFSELTKVKELALSVDSGLGWLNGPDRSIRARVLQAPPSIFGTRHHVPDRRTQAQREFWDYIQSMHTLSGEDVRLASLYRLEGTRLMTKTQEAGLMAATQPSLPFLDAHVPCEAIPHDVNECALSQPLEGSEMLDRYALGSPSANAGVLFTSTTLQHNDAAQNLNPIIPATLTKAQKEWLLETEWAQRAFMSSYMLSIIDNPSTFASIHTLHVSSLSDRYLPLLNRADFWNALPSLKTVTLIVIPGWRTVEKDEAGFVETPRVDPTGQVDTFCALLEAQVAPRSNITNLTIGYAASGEYAEGFHARNKLLMPAPVLPLRARHADPTLPPIETATVQNVGIIRQFLARFPYLQELTLRNCWVTPAALLEIVKVHDDYALKSLTLDSVSLTAVLRPFNNQPQVANPGVQQIHPNAAAVQHVVGALWAHLNNNAGTNANALNPNGQVIHNYIQVLVAQLQQMQANATGVQQHQLVNNLQAQLQQHLQNVQALTTQQPQGTAPPANPVQSAQQAQQQNNLLHVTQLNSLVAQVTMLQQIMQNQNAPAAAPTSVSTDNADSVLQARPREGSWMDIIDQISPGTNLSDFDSTHSQADSNRATSLDSISFISCGYAKLPYLSTAIDQTNIEAANGIAASLRNPLYTKRSSALAPSMLSAKWQYLGEIVQEVDLSELAALDAGWNLRHGWEDAETARAVEFDGLLSGGTGRFSGVVRRGDRTAAVR
ncbi:F-box domain-containing protein [Stagonosporopsis vannaccii]|nr:F-box domain-containing protein [Stagonosporopsis vannaccii]